MKILIFGGGGYIGAHAVLEVLEAGYDVIVFDNFSTGQRINIDSRAKIYTGDILSIKDLEKVFDLHDIDAVMHFCALKTPSESMADPLIYSDVNLIGSINIINIMLKKGVYKLIFSSSSAVYGEPAKNYINEDSPVDPKSFYGFTKLEIERILTWYSKITKLRFVALRYFNAAGYDTKGRIKHPEIGAPNLIPRIMESLSSKDKLLKVYGSDYNTPDGTCIRDYIHVTDLALAHIEALSFLDSNKSLIFNLATGVGYSVMEVIQIIERLSGKRVNYIITDRREGDPSRVVSKTKFNQPPLNWHPQFSDLETIIKSVLNVYKLKK